MTSLGTLDVLTFNLNNPGRERAGRQLAYLAARPEQVLVLTETADSAGCSLLEDRFRSAGYSVTFPRPEGRERGVMIVSRLETRPLETGVGVLPYRAAGVTVDTEDGPLDVIGLYVPSRNASDEKIERKRSFLQDCRDNLLDGRTANRVVLGDFNVLEPGHVPAYRFFAPFEYEFYEWLGTACYVDAFRHLHPELLDYSWVGRTGDGYRYDHAHVSRRIVGRLRGCSYVHEPRTMEDRLTDHSALTVQLAISAAAPLVVADPVDVPVVTEALF
ncbi:endonuclease/exonuclease/phosphatase family protein [Streptomyces sp. H27-H5]|uniref:endonuclease/exonuclease/phosphatase family protein n=1 Tax=Streptomyces sp. H27-H5 TaxID=2996460 RepID=UPI0022714749|nr:endonuclease/exonuclease/phosphatase family protein [Streptomyces sp. H27-H5]MCY0961932.1 endonuclease/exonuclease/phosphatase [Streptomyces sp. H27-H5]